MNTIEGNKLIMDFLGWKHHSGDVYWFPNLYPSDENTGETTFNIDEARFHSSWDWLMPVVEKIGNYIIPSEASYNTDGHLRFEIVVNGYVKLSGFPMPSIFKNVSNEGSLINATWLAVIDFIEWHNKEQKHENKMV